MASKKKLSMADFKALRQSRSLLEQGRDLQAARDLKAARAQFEQVQFCSRINSGEMNGSNPNMLG